MVNTNGLRSLIYGNYKSQSAFADRIGWSRQKVANIIYGRQEPTVTEVNIMAVALHKSVGEMAEFFLPN